MSKLTKLGLLVRLIPSHPLEFFERVATVVEVRAEKLRSHAPQYQTSEFLAAMSQLGNGLERTLPSILAEQPLREIEDWVQCKSAETLSAGPFASIHNADLLLARCAYVLCRHFRPRVVVETGVAYGVTSAFVLQALQGNGGGTLSSIDLPPLAVGADRHVGAFVPPRLRERWTLYRGSSRRRLPEVLAKLGPVDIFIHDSLHTHANMSREFRLVWPVLRGGGVLLADDIEQNTSFLDFAVAVVPHVSFTVHEESKESVFGVLVKQS